MKIVLLLGLSLTLSTSGFAIGGDDEPPNGKVVHTTLSKIRSAPNAYRNVWVTFKIQYVSLGKIKNPFFTEFVPAKYANFYGWAAEQPIWRKDQYEDLYGMFFMKKQNDQTTRRRGDQGDS